MGAYLDYLKSKAFRMTPKGIEPHAMNKRLRQDQIHVAGNALRQGRYAVFADCGLGKTLVELEWAMQVAERAGDVLILAPLCVAIQTQEMAREFGYEIHLCKSQEDHRPGVNITNYDRLHKFEPEKYSGVVLDESGILKNYGGKIRSHIQESFADTPYKLAATATPAPNDWMELGTHSEFLGVMTRGEMLSMFFVHDGGETQKWRLKGHAEGAFWEWVNTWSVTYQKPSDLDPSYSDEGFDLPGLEIKKHVLISEHPTPGFLFIQPVNTFEEFRASKRGSIKERCDRAIELVEKHPGYWVLWCDLNREGDYLDKAMPEARQIKGSMDIEEKEEILWAFTKGEIKTLITKQKITGFGLNWQHCHQTAFVGPNYSYEAAYQAIKRFHRFGQKQDVKAHWIMMDSQVPVFQILQRKMDDHDHMREVLSCAS